MENTYNTKYHSARKQNLNQAIILFFMGVFCSTGDWGSALQIPLQGQQNSREQLPGAKELSKNKLDYLLLRLAQAILVHHPFGPMFL